MKHITREEIEQLKEQAWLQPVKQDTPRPLSEDLYKEHRLKLLYADNVKRFKIRALLREQREIVESLRQIRFIKLMDLSPNKHYHCFVEVLEAVGTHKRSFQYYHIADNLHVLVS